MSKYLLVYDNGQGYCILDTVMANSIEAAKGSFRESGWVFGEVMSEADYLQQQKDESDLNALECQSNEQ